MGFFSKFRKQDKSKKSIALEDSNEGEIMDTQPCIGQSKIDRLEIPTHRELSDLEFIEKRTKVALLALEKNKKINLTPVSNYCLLYISTSFVKLVNTSNLSLYLNLFLDVGISTYRRRYSKSEEIDVEINGEIYNLSSIDESYSHWEPSYYNWFILYSVAQIRGEDKYRNLINEIIIERTTGDYKYFWYYAYQFFLAIEQDDKEGIDRLFKELKKVINLTESYKGKGGAKDINIKWTPIFELYYLGYNNKEKEFNELLRKYLIDKRNFIEKNNDADSSSYWLDYYMIGCCAFALDRGMNINVKSDYIPTELYTREFKKKEKRTENIKG